MTEPSIFCIKVGLCSCLKARPTLFPPPQRNHMYPSLVTFTIITDFLVQVKLISHVPNHLCSNPFARNVSS